MLTTTSLLRSPFLTQGWTLGGGGVGGGVGGGGGGEGAPLTVTLTVASPLSRVELKQVRLKSVVADRGPVDWLPEVALVPFQPPLAVQDVALVEDQVKVLEPPEVTVVGLALSETVGAGVGGGLALVVTERAVL